MAKLINAIPLSGKRRIVLRSLKLFQPTAGDLMKANLEDVLKQIDKEYNLQDPVDKKKYFFRIVKIGFDLLNPRHTGVAVFGRPYSVTGRNSNIGYDSVIAPDSREWWGLWHDATVLKNLGATSDVATKLDSIPVVDMDKRQGNFSIIVDVVTKISK